jgi:hypothetical protein
MAIIMNNYDRVRDELQDNPDDISMFMRRLLKKKFAKWFPSLQKAFGMIEAVSDEKTFTLEDCVRIWANDSEALQSVGITCPEDMLEVVADGAVDGGLSLEDIARRVFFVSSPLPRAILSMFRIAFSQSLLLQQLRPPAIDG